MAYRTLLFDIDDTLLDFQAAEHQAMEHLFKDLNLTLTPAIYTFYHDENEALWHDFEQGLISRADLLVKRFKILFDHLGLEGIDPQAAEIQYRKYLSEGHITMPYATELLDQLRSDHRMYIVTNGVAETQKRRLMKAGMTDYFDQVFISELIGAKKPEPAFFESVAAQIGQFNKRDTAIIGDSLVSDIKGGNGFGIDTIWVNPKHQANVSGIKPTYEVTDLRQIIEITA